MAESGAPTARRVPMVRRSARMRPEMALSIMLSAMAVNSKSTVPAASSRLRMISRCARREAKWEPYRAPSTREAISRSAASICASVSSLGVPDSATPNPL